MSRLKVKNEWVEVDGKARPVCPICSEPILRNLAVVDGVYYHYGCWKHRRGRKIPPWLPLWICIDCSHITSRPKSMTVNGNVVRFCPKCGGPVRLLKPPKPEASIVLV